MSDALEVSSAAEPSASSVKLFVRQVEGAAAYLMVAHADDRVRIAPPKAPERRSPSSPHRGWYSDLVNASAKRLRQLMVVFATHPARGPGAAAELEAFKMLLELTPAGPQLLALARRDRGLAYKELARHMELVRRQFEAAAALADDLASLDETVGEASAPNETGEAGFPAVRDALLQRAGGALTLTEAAKLLSVSRQALHKRISAGTALGMMVDTEIAVPRLQIVQGDDKASILRGIDAVTKLFKQAEAGAWMALQFLVDPDPNLGRPPIEALKEGDVRSVVQAAHAHLRLDEE